MGKAANLAAIGSIADTPLMFRNRILNGDCRLDQRYAGGNKALTNTEDYIIDRWIGISYSANTVTFARSTQAPAGFTNSFSASNSGTQSAAGFYGMRQKIEGYNVADFGWGAAGAQTATLSFWVRSSVTGTYCVSIKNGAADRSFVANYTINSANTWEYKTIVIAGDTSGTWLKDNGNGVFVDFVLSVATSFQTSSASTWIAGAYYITTSASNNWSATNGATFYITGVQFERGANQNPVFENRPYGVELMMCQRYCQKLGALQFFGSATVRTGGGAGYASLAPKVDMRSSPTITSSGTPVIYVGDTNATITGYTAGDGTSSLLFGYTSNAAGSVGQSGLLYTNTGGSITFSAEL